MILTDVCSVRLLPSYSYSGLTTQVTSPNTTTVTVENALGETVSQTTNGKKVSYTYYASGAVKAATPEGGAPISMEYDLVGNRTKLTEPGCRCYYDCL